MTRAVALGRANLFLSLTALLLTLAPGRAAAARIVTMGTGGVTGVYYPVGGAICRLVNRAQDYHGLRCLVESTAGSADNIERVLDGRIEFAITQSDVLWKAVHGEAPFLQPASESRAVMSLYPETALLAVARASGIAAPSDLKGKRLNLGAEGSGTRATAEDALAAIGLALPDLAWAGDLSLEELPRAAAEGRLDAFFLLAGHPSDGLKAILSAWDARLVPLSGGPFAALIAAKPYYVPAEVPGGIYAGVEEPVPTFAVKATLVTSVDLAEATVYNLVKSVLIAEQAFRRMHPALAGFHAAGALEGLAAPLHPGACRYYRESGLGCPP